MVPMHRAVCSAGSFSAQVLHHTVAQSVINASCADHGTTLGMQMQAEVSGEVVKVMIENGQPVTPGQVSPSGMGW